jgi:hypothetical protein
MESRIRLVGLCACLLSAVATLDCAGQSSGNGTGGSSGSGTGGQSSTGSGGTSNATGGHGGSGGSGATGGTGTGGTAAGGASGHGGSIGTGGGSGGSTSTGSGGGSGGGAKGGTGGGSGGVTGAGGATGGTGGAIGTGGATGSGGATGASSCLDDMQNGTETGVDCGGSCGACPSYQINPPNLKNNVQSGCGTGSVGQPSSTSGFMCPRSMVFSPELKQAEADDFGSPTDPQFVYGTVGHDEDSGGLDKNNTCCECYQLVFVSSRDGVTGLPTPKPMIVQAFNTAAGGGKNFDIYMGAGGEGSNSAGCPPGKNGSSTTGLYTGYPSLGQPNSGGARATNISACAGSMNAYSEASIAAMSCQTAIAAECEMITSSSSSLQSASQGSCEETSQPQNFYHMNWNVLAERIECPTNLTRVTGCKLASQGLPMADPTAVDSTTATSAKGFLSGYTTTTMQDCCRPTCAYSTNVQQSGVTVDSQYGAFYTCDLNGNPS